MDNASAETDVSRIMVNLEAQHKYLTWRAEKVGEAIFCSIFYDSLTIIMGSVQLNIFDEQFGIHLHR